jgi:protease-4
MRLILALLFNLAVLLWRLLGLPARLIRARRRPQFIRFVLRGDPPYRQALRRRWFERRDPAQVRTVEELGRQIEVIARDRRVRGALFVVDRLEVSPAKADSIAALFRQLQASRKEVIGYALRAGNADYELLCATDRILFAPPGRLDLIGFAAEATALGAWLQRLGVTAQFVRRGTYKTAPELFTESRVTEVQHQTIEQLLDQRFSRLLETVSKGRRIGLDEARRKIDAGPYSARRALAEGLCDALCSEADLASFLRGPKEPAKGRPADLDHTIGSFAAYTRASFGWPSLKELRPRPRVAVVPVSGIIAEGEGGKAPFGPEFAGSESITSALRAAAHDSSSRGILLYVDSPGGSALASEIILDEVRRAAKKKPVVAYFDRVAASGGYMAALGAQEIWGAPNAITGSIGVFGGKFELSGLLKRLGIERAVVTRGENSALFSPSRPFTEHERRSLEIEIEDAYQDFLALVAAARGRTKDEIHARGEGRVYSGAQAQEVGLIDRTGSFDQACRRALELADVPAEQFQVHLFRAGKRRIPGLGVFRQLLAERLFALWVDRVEPWSGWGAP